jgi:predicted transposase YdaD
LVLLHIEFQSYEDTTMGRRMLEYNVLAEHQYELPVSSFVIYLRKRRVPRPPYVRTFIDGHVTHYFYYRVIKLWEIPAQVILDLGWEGLLPLLTLTKGGKKPEMVEIMLNRLSHDRDLLALAEMYGGLAFTNELEKARFKRRFFMFQDIMKDSWVYQEVRESMRQEVTQEVRQAVTQEVRQEVTQKSVQSHRQTIVEIVSKRFPLLSQLASQQVARMADLDALRMLTVNISVADNVEAARRELMDAVRS